MLTMLFKLGERQALRIQNLEFTARSINHGPSMMEKTKLKLSKLILLLLLVTSFLGGCKNANHHYENCLLNKYLSTLDTTTLLSRAILVDIINEVDESHNSLIISQVDRLPSNELTSLHSTSYKGVDIYLRNFKIMDGKMNSYLHYPPPFLSNLNWDKPRSSILDISSSNEWNSWEFVYHSETLCLDSVLRSNASVADLYSKCKYCPVQ